MAAVIKILVDTWFCLGPKIYEWSHKHANNKWCFGALCFSQDFSLIVIVPPVIPPENLELTV